MKAAVIIFPGINREKDMMDVLRAEGDSVEAVFHKDSSLPSGLDVIILPGGFSYGDYLRAGAMAAQSPIMAEVVKAAEHGTTVLGVCNGFQILCEAGLLEGALTRNRDLQFICDHVHLRVEKTDCRFTAHYAPAQVIKIPIANVDGNYYAADEILQRLNDNGQILFRYCSPEGDIDDSHNPNGSRHNIAGITNERGNVLGFMPHPENAFFAHQLSRDGQALFSSIRDSV